MQEKGLGLCVVKGCDQPARPDKRGCCGACYQAAYRLVSSGKATWTQLEKKKLVRKPKRNRLAGLARKSLKIK